jgi:site-specific recombinase XerD
MSCDRRPSLGDLLESFFRQRLIAQRKASHNTVAAYRDALRLFLVFAAERQGKTPSRLALADLDRDVVLAFLGHLEQERHNSVSTRNARLAAIRSFFHHIAASDPGAMGIAQRVLSIPTKRTTKRMLGYLDQKDLETILAAPDRTTLLGQRDYALLTFIARTGARVSEACDVNVEDLRLQWPQQVLLRGKGAKERAIPLSKGTAKLLKALCDQRRLPPDSEAALFVNARGQRLTRHGVTHVLKRAVATASGTKPELADRAISPHTLRHTKAMHLLQSGVDLTTIQSWLGHASPNTTHHYVEADLEMKRRALEKCVVPDTPHVRYQPPDEVLAFLTTLFRPDHTTIPSSTGLRSAAFHN